MIPSPLDDINLLREHFYQDNVLDNLHFVLNALKFTDIGGFKPARDFGLGFYNYDIRLKDNIYNPELLSQLGYSIFSHFEILLFAYIVVLVYSLSVLIKIDNVSILDHGLYLFKNKKIMMNKHTRLLDLQEKGEYNNNKRNSSKNEEDMEEGEDNDRNNQRLNIGKDESSTSLNETNKLHSRANNNNNLEYNHIKL